MTEWLIRVLKGAIIGVGAILPGISGGVLSVVLGIYRPIMAFLAHPVKTFRRNINFLVPLGIGFALGVIVLSRGVDWLLRTSPTPAIWLFIGLVVGTLPSLYKEAGAKGRPKGAWVALVAGALCMGGILLLLSHGGRMAVTPNFYWWMLCGVMWGLGLVVPGLSPSSFFIFFGLYQPMTAGIGHFDFGVIIPLAIGLLATVALLARGMNKLLDFSYTYVMHAILGIVIASTIAIIPLDGLESITNILIYIACFAVGLFGALGMDKLGEKVKPTK